VHAIGLCLPLCSHVVSHLWRRYAGSLPHVFESTTAGITIATPQLDINTVAAGGGSRLFLQSGRLVVGPESAGSHPGPVAYRKAGGLLAVTDANVVLGRVIPALFPNIFGPDENLPLDSDGARDAFTALIASSPSSPSFSTPEQLAYGFLQVANEAMCRPIRNLTQMRGYDITSHVLSCFGGAGPQHACAIAKKLGMKTVHVHKYGGVLSAYGLSLSDAVVEVSGPANEVYQPSAPDTRVAAREARFAELELRCTQQLLAQGYPASIIETERFLNLRYEGTDTAVMTPAATSFDAVTKSFKEHYMREFGFDLNRDVIVDDYRVRGVVHGDNPPPLLPALPSSTTPDSAVVMQKNVYFESGWQKVNVYDLEKLLAGQVIQGPAIIVQSISTIVVEEACVATVTSEVS